MQERVERRRHDQGLGDMPRHHRETNRVSRNVVGGQLYSPRRCRYPVLFAVDDVQALYAATKYKNPQFETLQSYNFSVPRLALNFLSGRKNLVSDPHYCSGASCTDATKARGMVVSAYSHTTPNVPLSPEFSYALELDSTRPITPYTKMDPAHLAHATAPATKIEVPFGLSTQEAAGMFELWSRRGWTLKCECTERVRNRTAADFVD